MSCSLALGVTVMAQAPQEQQTPAQAQGQGQEQGQGKKAARQEARQEQRAQRQQARQERKNAGGQENAANPQNANAGRGKRMRGGNADVNASPNATANPKVHTNAETNANANVSGGKRNRQGKHQHDTANEESNTGAAATGAGAAAAGAAVGGAAATGGTTQQVGPTNSQTQTNVATNAQTNNPGGRGRKVDAQRVQTIKSQHANFRAQPRPDKVQAVTFNQNYRIQGADRWQGEHYSTFRSYHPEWHDQGWYHSHFPRIEVFAGGAYYWNNGYWFPAWGYNPSAQYYAYDAPIYVGRSALPPDQVIANVQAVLQEEGYYRGEVDGLLGPLTREALTAYQADHGLVTTAMIDEPTLDSLDMG